MAHIPLSALLKTAGQQRDAEQQLIVLTLRATALNRALAKERDVYKGHRYMALMEATVQSEHDMFEQAAEVARLRGIDLDGIT